MNTLQFSVIGALIAIAVAGLVFLSFKCQTVLLYNLGYESMVQEQIVESVAPLEERIKKLEEQLNR